MAIQTRLSIAIALLAILLSACATTGDEAGKVAQTEDNPVGKVAVAQTEDDPAWTSSAKAKNATPKVAPATKSGAATEKRDDSKRVKEVKELMRVRIEAQKEYDEKKRGAKPNAFYRYKREQAVKQALIDDGVHDPAADLSSLQPPIEALKGFPSSTFGDGVNWVEALHKHQIKPRADQTGTKKQFALEMNILMPVKGTMKDVMFPHKIHTEWLACVNCHTGIFQMKKDANPITMEKITKGKYCGVCHGKVAFPIANCNRCHSAPKKTAKAGKKKK